MTVPNSESVAWKTLRRELAGIEVIEDPAQVAKLSLDYHTFSPILAKQLAGKQADLVVRPANEAEVLRVAAACAHFRVPITIRGAGTGNYGQCVPLAGGVVLDMTRLNAIRWLQPGMARVEAGTRLAMIDRQAQELGWEIRLAPSTYRTATIGGFIAGGSGGIGSITYGQLGDRGNVLGLRVVTAEEDPQIIELRGDGVQKVNHAWGINGIITEVEIPLGPAYPWVEMVVTFTDFMAAARFGWTLGNADGLIKKLVSIHAWPIPTYLGALQPYLSPSQHCALLMVAESALAGVAALVTEYGGTITLQKVSGDKGLAIAEYTWNHTTLHARSMDPTITYLQTFFPADPGLKLVEQLYHHYGDEVLMHLEYLRVNGRVTPVGLQLVRYTTAQRLEAIMAEHEAQGASIANPHTYIIEAGGRKMIDPIQLEFKAMVDPYNLMNLGKMQAPISAVQPDPE